MQVASFCLVLKGAFLKEGGGGREGGEGGRAPDGGRGGGGRGGGRKGGESGNMMVLLVMIAFLANPAASIFAWTRGLSHRAKLDGKFHCIMAYLSKCVMCIK